MKKTLTFSLAIVAILWAGSMCMGQEKARQKKQGARAKVSADQKAWQEKLKNMTPEQQQVARAKKAFGTSVAPWRKVRKIALQEKATKTLAAIDQIIAAKEKQFSRRMAGPAKGKAKPQARVKRQAGAKKQAEKKAGRQARPQAKRQGAAKKQAEKKGARQARPKKKTEGKK